MPSLLRTEAAERAALLSDVWMDVTLTLTRSDSFTSSVMIDFDCAREGASTFVDFKGTEIIGAELNGEPLEAVAWRDGRIALTGLRAGRNRFGLSGRMAYSSDGEGLHRHVDPADGRAYLYAMSFLDAAPRVFACFDQPDIKACYRFEVSVPGGSGWRVWGNGPARPETFEESVNRLARGDRWFLGPTEPLATYFVTLVAGPYAAVTGEHDGIPLTLLARQSLRAELEREAPDILEVTGACLDAYHDLFGVRYAFGGYAQAFVPDFNAGAMENPGCVTFRDQMLLRGVPTRRERAQRAVVIAHEMAHQWFGDLVTMRWWDDLWLNESFAEYLGYRVCAAATRYDDVWSEFGLTRKAWGAAADQGPNAHPVAGNGAADARGALASFDGISYAKGAVVLRQVARRLGEDVFGAGLRDYIERYRFGNAALADLLAAWTRAGAVGLEGFARAWLRTAGMDLVAASCDGPGGCARLTVTPPAAPAGDGGTPVREHTIEVADLAPDGTVAATAGLTAGPGVTPLELAVAPGHVLVPDAGDVTWARLRPSSWALPPLARIERASVRVVAHNAVWDAVRAGEVGIGTALDLLEAGLPGEPSDAIVAAGLARAVQWAGAWSAPTARPARRARVAALAHRLAADAEPGGDRQLDCVRAWARVTDDTSLLAAWLGGEDLPEGVAVDDELRWAWATRLVLLGGDPGIVEERLREDDSSAGHDHAAAARAAVPRLEAKRTALDVVLKPSDKRVYEVIAVGGALWPPEQAELTAPLVGEYFAGLPGIAAFREGWGLARCVEASFPYALSSPATLALARAAGAVPGLDDRVARVIADGVDQMDRIVRAQARPD